MRKTAPSLSASVLAALAEAQAPVMPPPAVAARLRRRVLDACRDQGEAAATEAPPPSPLFTLRGHQGDWIRLTLKVEMKVLRQDTESCSFLLRLAPGAVLPAHDHPIDEECYVLEGEVRFGDLRVTAGDYHLAPKGQSHGVVRSRTGALLLLRGAPPPAP